MPFLSFIATFLLAGLLNSCAIQKPVPTTTKSAPAETFAVRAHWNQYLQACGVTGSVVVYAPTQKTWWVSDSADAFREALPASTFKIINLLIALEAGVIKYENEVVRWPGHTDTTLYGYRPEIYHDMTVCEAFEVSAGWVFIELARKIGKARYRKFLTASGYGNGQLEGTGEDFWNFGHFGISPVQQIQFLRKVYAGTTPFSARNVAILKKVMVTETQASYTIRAKTGWTREGGQNTGWWVGYVESSQGPYFFATRVYQDRKATRPDFAPCRKDITKAALRDLKALPAN